MKDNIIYLKGKSDSAPVNYIEFTGSNYDECAEFCEKFGIGYNYDKENNEFQVKCNWSNLKGTDINGVEFNYLKSIPGHRIMAYGYDDGGSVAAYVWDTLYKTRPDEPGKAYKNDGPSGYKMCVELQHSNLTLVDRSLFADSVQIANFEGKTDAVEGKFIMIEQTGNAYGIKPSQVEEKYDRISFETYFTEAMREIKYSASDTINAIKRLPENAQLELVSILSENLSCAKNHFDFKEDFKNFGKYPENLSLEQQPVFDIVKAKIYCIAFLSGQLDREHPKNYEILKKTYVEPVISKFENGKFDIIEKLEQTGKYEKQISDIYSKETALDNSYITHLKSQARNAVEIVKACVDQLPTGEACEVIGELIEDLKDFQAEQEQELNYENKIENITDNIEGQYE